MNATNPSLTRAQEDLIHAERLPQHETSFIVLSDLHLDNHKIMVALEKLLGAYEDMDDTEKPSLFVLCGNFRSRPFLFDGEATREYQGAFIAKAPSTDRQLADSLFRRDTTQSSSPRSPRFSANSPPS